MAVLMAAIPEPKSSPLSVPSSAASFSATACRLEYRGYTFSFAPR
jgi:hypothetical protein